MVGLLAGGENIVIIVGLGMLPPYEVLFVSRNNQERVGKKLRIGDR